MKTLQIRMTDDERRRLEIVAAADGRSLNNYMMALLRNNLAHREALEKGDKSL